MIGRQANNPMAATEGPVPLSEDECRALLNGDRAGYLATTARALPTVIPVLVALVGDALVVAPAFDQRARLAEHAVVALAIGNLSYGQRPPDVWTVLAQGTLRPPRPDLALDQAPIPFEPSRCRALETAVLTGWRHTAPPTTV
jgi:hypothetical protein